MRDVLKEMKLWQNQKQKIKRERGIIMGINSILTTLLLMVSLMGAVQPIAAQSEAARRAEVKEKIGLDLSVPDFETKRIDAKVMGERLAGILAYLMENYHQTVYDRKLGLIASEQNEAMENVYF